MQTKLQNPKPVKREIELDFIRGIAILMVRFSREWTLCYPEPNLPQPGSSSGGGDQLFGGAVGAVAARVLRLVERLVGGGE
jgi:hypothetical protein